MVIRRTISKMIIKYTSINESFDFDESLESIEDSLKVEVSKSKDFAILSNPKNSEIALKSKIGPDKPMIYISYGKSMSLSVFQKFYIDLKDKAYADMLFKVIYKHYENIFDSIIEFGTQGFVFPELIFIIQEESEYNDVISYIKKIVNLCVERARIADFFRFNYCINAINKNPANEIISEEWAWGSSYNNDNFSFNTRLSKLIYNLNSLTYQTKIRKLLNNPYLEKELNESFDFETDDEKDSVNEIKSSIQDIKDSILLKKYSKDSQDNTNYSNPVNSLYSVRNGSNKSILYTKYGTITLDFRNPQDIEELFNAYLRYIDRIIKYAEEKSSDISLEELVIPDFDVYIPSKETAKDFLNLMNLIFEYFSKNKLNIAVSNSIDVHTLVNKAKFFFDCYYDDKKELLDLKKEITKVVRYCYKEY